MFKKLLSKLSNQSIFHKIIQSKQSKQSQFSLAIQQFSQYDHHQKQQTFNQIFGMFKKQRSTKTILTCLILIDYLYSLQPEISLFRTNERPKILYKENKKQSHLLANKLHVAEEHFIKFYYQFLKQSNRKTQKQINFTDCELNQWIYYCQISVNQIIQLIKIDFVINFLIKNIQQIELLRLCLSSILQKVSFDIKILNRFISKHLLLIKQKHSQSFKINQIYQKLLHINHNIPKLDTIIRLLSITKKISFQPYKIDTQLNKTIQIQLHQRQQQKKEYILLSSRKRLESNKNINNGKNNYKREKQCGNQENEDNQQGLTQEGDTIVRLNDFI